MKQLTIRFDDDLDGRIREVAAAEGISLNRAAVRLLRRGAGLDRGGAARKPRIGDSLDRFFGTWTDVEADRMRAAEQEFGRIDPEFWEA